MLQTIKSQFGISFFFLNKNVLIIFYFLLENIGLFNPNDQGNWSAWATALPQCTSYVRTICGDSTEINLFMSFKISYLK